MTRHTAYGRFGLAAILVTVVGSAALVGCDDPVVPERPPIGEGLDLEPVEVTGVTPLRGLPGDELTITGSGFIPGMRVTVGGGTAELRSLNDTTIVAIVPPYAATGPVRVSDPAGWRLGVSDDSFQFRAPDGIGYGYNGSAGQPTISSAMPATQDIDSTQTKITITGSVSGAQTGYWSIIDENAYIRSSGTLEAAAGDYSQQVPLFCGDQRLVVFFENDNGRSFYRTDINRTECTDAGIRVQLHWDIDISDVDLHLIRPGGSDRTDGDCYYANCQSSDGLDWGEPGEHDDPRLDVDDVDGTDRRTSS